MNWRVYFLLASVAAAQQTIPQPDSVGLVEGHVIHAATGEAIRKAHVILEGSAIEHDSELVATSDEAGHFRFANVSPGVYRLMADKTGLLSGGYGQVKAEDAQTLLKVSAGERVEDVTLRLFPAGTINGRILDGDGDPAAGYEVVLWTRHRHRRNTPNSPADQTTTNQSGEYRFDGLMPGAYYVSAGKESSGLAVREIPVDAAGRITKVHQLRTFHPAAISLSDAQSIRIESGQEQPGVDIQIQRGPLLSVKGRIAGTLSYSSKYEVSATVEEGMGWTSEGGEILPNGDFVFDELPPGKHRLILLDHSMSGPEEIGATEVNLVDQDVTGIVITPFRPAQVRVRVTMEGEDKLLTTGSVSLNPDHWDGHSWNSLSQYPPQNGTYLIDAVPPDKYQVWFNGAPGCYLKSVQSGGRLLNAEAIDVTEGANLDLLMTFSKKVASVSGDVEASESQASHPMRVLLISEDTASEWNKISLGELDQSLHFSIEHMRPGKYIAFAAQEDDFDLWDNADFVKLLQSEGTEVELHESQHANLHLKLITKGVTDHIRQ